MKWDYEGTFLNRFDKDFTGAIGHLFCNEIRHLKAQGLNVTVLSVIDAVIDTLEDRLFRTPGMNEKAHNTYSNLLFALNVGDGENFVSHLIWREGLSHEEKTRLKNEAKTNGAKSFMASQPPTEKQIAYLRSLGSNETPQSKLEASEMIDRLLKRCAA